MYKTTCLYLYLILVLDLESVIHHSAMSADELDESESLLKSGAMPIAADLYVRCDVDYTSNKLAKLHEDLVPPYPLSPFASCPRIQFVRVVPIETREW